jgi:ubiquinol-cytochrome c reductase iron-sulfur subunit
MTEGPGPHDAPGAESGAGTRRMPTPEELDRMGPEELAGLAAELDDVEIVQKRSRWPISGTRAEKRAERTVAGWFILSAVAGIVFLVAFVAWPNQYVPPDDPGHLMYSLYTPVVGGSLGLSILALGIGAIAYVKRFLPVEVSVQQRHDGRSDELARRTVVGQLQDAGRDLDIGRRSLIKRTAIAAGAFFGLGLVFAGLGGLIRNPWAQGDDSPLLVTDWASPNGERVYLRRDTGDPHEVSLVRPDELAAGSVETVFPFRESDRGREARLNAGLRAADSITMLIRFRPGTPVVFRAGQENFHYGDYYAFSKVCTHLGCPASLYEDQTNRLLCPCHQSQFQANEYARPIFGPATRPLPQLPIAVDERGFFYARSDYVEPVGPAYWERKS